MNRNLQGWLALLEARHPVEIDLGLERVAEVYKRLGDVRPAARIVTIGGTNGKGSCVAMLDAILRAAGVRTATYTSPHLLHFNERVTVDGSPVSDQQLCAAFERLEAARGDVSLTYFEFTTLAAFLVMADANVEVAVLEVGLGGRLDVVNVVDADIAIVTSIALDHESWLGDTREAVAVEKLGIGRLGRPLLCGETDLPGNFEDQVAAVGCHALYLGRDFEYPQSLPAPNLPGPSVACALQAARLLHIQLPGSVLHSLVVEVGLKGRFQRVHVNGVELVLDVAHNPAAAKMLARRLNEPQSTFRSSTAVTAMMADKDIDGVIKELAPTVHHWVVAPLPDISRAASTDEVLQLLYNDGHSASAAVSVGDALQQALDRAGEGERIVVFGSFFTVAAALQWLQQRGVIENV